MSTEFQHILIVSLFVGFNAAILVGVIVALVYDIGKAMSGVRLGHRAFALSLIPVIAVVTAFLLIYGSIEYEKLQSSVDKRGDIRFTVSDDGIDIWARRNK